MVGDMSPLTRASVLRLIELRAEVIRLGLDDAENKALCAKIIAADELDALRDQLLDMLGRVANDLHSERGRLALWAAIAKIPGDDSRPTAQRQAARLIQWYAAASSARDYDDVALNNQACDEFDSVTAVVNALLKPHEALVAICDVWLGLLPELTNTDVLASLAPA
jgi:hypothetical protein